MKDPAENAYAWPEALEREFDESFARMQGPEADAGFKKLLEATPDEIAEMAVRRHHQPRIAGTRCMTTGTDNNFQSDVARATSFR